MAVNNRSDGPTDPSLQAAPACCPSCPTGPQRRGALKTLIALASGVAAYAIPVFTGIASFLNPLRQKSEAGDFRRLATLDMLPEDGAPVQVTVVADRNDAWNRFPHEPIGGVFLRRLPSGEVLALHVVCPHAGCTVQYQAGEKKLFCPCHMASFDLDGKRTDTNSPSPRDLDTLDIEIRNDSEVWVRFVNFRTGIPDKVVEA